MPSITLAQFLIVAIPIAIPAMGSMLAAILPHCGLTR